MTADDARAYAAELSERAESAGDRHPEYERMTTAASVITQLANQLDGVLTDPKVYATAQKAAKDAADAKKTAEAETKKQAAADAKPKPAPTQAVAPPAFIPTALPPDPHAVPLAPSPTGNEPSELTDEDDGTSNPGTKRHRPKK